MGDPNEQYGEYLTAARVLLSDNEDSADLWEANDLANQALALRPRSAEAWLLKGQVLSALADPVAALACIEMTLRKAPRLSEAHYWHAALLADLERFVDGLKALERAFRYLTPEDDWLVEELYYEKANIFHALGREEDARQVFRDGLELCPQSVILQAGLQPLERESLRRSFQVLDGGRAR